MTMTVLDPTATAISARRITLAPRTNALSGLALGVLDNGKPNSDRFLEELVSLLRREHDLAEVVWARKPNIGRLAPPELVDELASKCDAVVTGVGDCAGCCSCSAHDAIALEDRSLPTAMICTSEFHDAARTIASMLGLPDYPFTVVPHPLGSLTPDELKDRAAGAMVHVSWAITSAQPSRQPAMPVFAATARPPAQAGVSCEC